MADEKMELAHAWVLVNDVGSNIQMKYITPAQAVIIRKQFGVKVEGDAKPVTPFQHLDVLKESALNGEGKSRSQIGRAHV